MNDESNAKTVLVIDSCESPFTAMRQQIESLTREKAELQEKLTDTEQYLHVYSIRAHAERDKRVELEESVTTLRAELDAATKVIKRIATHDCGCSPCHGLCIKGIAAEIELEARMEQAQEYLDTARARPGTAAEETK